MLAPSLEGGEQKSQDTLFVADREKSCVLVGILTLLLAPLPPLEAGGEHDTLHEEEALHYCVELQTEEQEVRISQKK